MMENVLGIDIGGRSLKLKGYDSESNVYTEHLPICNLSKEQLFEIVSRFISKYGYFKKIGISQAGMVKNDCLINCARHPLLNGLSGSWFVRNALCSSAILINDAEAVAVYAHEVTSSNNVVVLIIGTGLGCAMWKDTDIVFNAGGLSNINDIIVDGIPIGKRCASIAIHTDEEKEWVLSNLKLPQIIEKIEKAAKYFGTVIEIVDQKLNPDTIFISGGVSQFPNYFDIAVRNSKTKANAVLCTNSEFAGCDGASLYVTKYAKKSEGVLK